MGEEPLDREVEQAIVALKKGAHLLKYGRRGKPKFCPFRLSTDEKLLIWYSGKEEKQLRLTSVTKIIPGQRTVNFLRQPQPEKESQSFSLVYANGERSLDLVCKDKEQADSWFVGLRALISRSHHYGSLCTLRNRPGAQTCANSPVGYSRRRNSLGLEDSSKYSQVRSLCGSPPRSLAERCFSDGLSHSSEGFYSSEPRSLLSIRTAMDFIVPHLSYMEPNDLKEKRRANAGTGYRVNLPYGVRTHSQCFPSTDNTEVLRDVLMWGEGIEGGTLGGRSDRFGNPNGTKFDALLPKLLESTMMLDVSKISLGGQHAAIVTKQGEVFCWGEGNRGKLGHKINMDISEPKIVDSLKGIHVESVACGEHHTCAVTLYGELYTWGDNSYGIGLIGDGNNASQWLPCKLSGPLGGTHISSVACGDWHTAVLSSSGQLFTYGDGTFGVLGHGNHQSVSQPKEVESLKGLRVKSVACGPWHTAAVVDVTTGPFKISSSTGKLFTWGDGDKGRLGHLDRERKLVPTCVSRLMAYDFVQVSCGRMLTVALTDTGMVWTMGSTVHGQLGNPYAGDKSINIVEGKLKGECVKEISSGSYHVAVLTSRGSVYTWGKGANGRLGLGDIEDRNSPTLVEALRDRQVLSVACGSSFTAAICLHKSIFSSDQSTCSSCKVAFGFTRKKHNCYNCGFSFCRTCSSKKVMNASLAPNKSKPFRVCDPCFNRLQCITQSDRLKKMESPGPRQPLTPRKVFSDLKIGRGEAKITRGSLFSPRLNNNEETKCNEGQVLIKQLGSQLHQDPTFPSSTGPPRWGQVPCPALFSTYETENSMALLPHSGNQLSSVPPAYIQEIPQQSKSITGAGMNVERGLSESDKFLIEEVRRLRAEAKTLEKQCQMKSEKLEECEQRLAETWSLARDEAAKCKAAKEVIRALTTRLHTMSEKLSVVREVNIIPVVVDGVDMNLPRTPPIHAESTDLIVSSGLPPEVGELAETCRSPDPFCNALSSTHERDLCPTRTRSGANSLPRTDSRRNATKQLKNEWVEQDEPGVYITFMILPSGLKGLKRVRFSRKRFSQKEAEQWWEENQLRVYQKYQVEGYISPGKN